MALLQRRVRQLLVEKTGKGKIKNFNDLREVMGDADGSGKVTFSEFQQFVHEELMINMHRTEVIKLFDRIDINKNGLYTYDDFVKVFRAPQPRRGSS